MFFLALPCALGPPRQLWISPINSFEHISHLRRRDRQNAIGRRWPDELSSVQSFGVKREPDAIMPKDFRQIAAATAEDVEIAGMGIAFQSLLNLKRKTLHPAPHVRMARRDPNSRAAGNGDHDRSAFNAATINGSLADAPMLTRTPSARSTTIAGSRRSSAFSTSGSSALTTARRKRGLFSWRFPFLRHVYTSPLDTSYRRATAEVTAPGAKASARIFRRSSSDHRRRRSEPVSNMEWTMRDS